MDETRCALLYLRRHALDKLAVKKQADYLTLKIRSSSIVDGQVSVTDRQHAHHRSVSHLDRYHHDQCVTTVYRPRARGVDPGETGFARSKSQTDLLRSNDSTNGSATGAERPRKSRETREDWHASSFSRTMPLSSSSLCPSQPLPPLQRLFRRRT